MKDYQTLIKKIARYFEENPELKIMGEKNSLADIQEIENTLGVCLNELYKLIISNFGGCYLGLPIYSLHKDFSNENVIILTQWFRELASQYKQPSEYMDFVAISEDGAGNYILITEKNNDLFFYDHETGEIESFEDEKLDGLIRDYIEA